MHQSQQVLFQFLLPISFLSHLQAPGTLLSSLFSSVSPYSLQGLPIVYVYYQFAVKTNAIHNKIVVKYSPIFRKRQEIKLSGNIFPERFPS